MIKVSLTLRDVRRLVEELADELEGDHYARALLVLEAIDLCLELERSKTITHMPLREQ